MSAETAINLAFAAFLALFAFVIWRFCRTPKPRARAKARDVIAAAREIDELELLYSLPAYDPAWDAGMERLWDAVRDNQNQTKGDQK